MGRTVGDPEVGTLLVKQLAFENAKKHCKEALRPYRKKSSLQDTIWLCSDVGGGYVQGMALATALKENLHSSKRSVCYTCKKQLILLKNIIKAPRQISHLLDLLVKD
jgi:hypothetical protein